MTNAFEIKNEIFTRLKSAVTAQVPGCMVSGEYRGTPSGFPAVTLEEKNNTVLAETSEASLIQTAVSLMYEINVYTNTVGYREDEARELMLLCDTVMSGLGFTRTMASPVPNLADSTIYRMTARYEGIARQEKLATQTTPSEYRIYQR